MRIPIIKATEELPRIPVTATTQGAGRTWEAVGRLSGVVRDIGLDLAQTQQKIRMAGDIAQAELDIEAANTDIVAKLRLKADPDTYVQDWATQFEQVTTKKLESIKGVRTRAAVEQLLSRIATREIGQQKDYANKLWIDTEKAKDIRTLDSYATQGQLDEGLSYLDKRSDLYNPVELEKLKGKFKKTTQTKIIKTLVGEAGMEIYASPGKADEILQKAKYAEIPEDKKLILLKKGDVIANRREKQAEDENEELQKENAFSLWQKYESIKTDPQELISFDNLVEDYAETRGITKKEYKALKKAIKTEEEKEEDNPHVMADLADQVILGMDIKENLIDAYDRGDLKKESYLNMRKALTAKNYKEGLNYINVIKPNEFEGYNPDISQRFGDAIRDYSMRVANGADPLKVSKEIVDLNIGDRRRTLTALRRPRFLVGEKNNLVNIEKAEQATVDAYINKKISPAEFMREAELLKELKAVATLLLEEPGDTNTKKLEKRIKE